MSRSFPFAPWLCSPTRQALLVALLATTGPGAAQAGVLTSTQVAKALVGAFDGVFGGPHTGERAVHTKGVVAEGRFEPAPEAASLSKAVHLNGGAVPVVVRFSNFAGVPTLPDGNPDAEPNGMAIKFMLPDGGATDIVAHSYDGFPAATPEEFLAFLIALGSKDPQAFPAHVAAHPAAQRFVDTPRPTPESYARQAFYGVNAFDFENAAGERRFGRYVITPLAGTAYLAKDEAAARGADFLAVELAARLQRGPAAFRLEVQLAQPGDSTTDGSIPWPADRARVTLGTLTLTSLAADSAARQRELFFTPLSLVDGIAPSDDPMLLARTRAYRVSYTRRQQDHQKAADLK
ncbi:catalase family peroxidase [Aurantimonas sp. MSK8Z-1]|uniref:catalase family peroxidase n=1 Tax=Mangrovibrevibacter kandeliae TaxID=2968473 RepID=UPI002117EE4A|nr:catalase family peroxidase [Aurantimonas sp. MSK8Z-1]MCW4116342.1 catalase family peroxidase [Aurantimonas sp. MSK8Z-1]